MCGANEYQDRRGGQKRNLKIYDVTGKLYSEFFLQDGIDADIMWDATGWPLGVYVVRLKTGQKEMTTNAILTK